MITFETNSCLPSYNNLMPPKDLFNWGPAYPKKTYALLQCGNLGAYSFAIGSKFLASISTPGPEDFLHPHFWGIIFSSGLVHDHFFQLRARFVDYPCHQKSTVLRSCVRFSDPQYPLGGRRQPTENFHKLCNRTCFGGYCSNKFENNHSQS